MALIGRLLNIKSLVQIRTLTLKAFKGLFVKENTS